MEKERWREISQIFNIALSKPDMERSDYLKEACGENEDLRGEIEVLLAASLEPDSFIDEPKIAIAAPKAEPRFRAGEKLGSFQVIELLGEGGMGEVYLAKDLRLNRQVALKILPQNSAVDQHANRRFLREAQAVAALEHPHICTIHEIGEGSGFSFIVMQYVEGETLSARIRRGDLKPQDTLDIAIQIAHALAEAHEHGIVHRDIKPANIIVSPNNQIKVLDFGLAKRIVFDSSDHESSLKSLLSQPGMILGTVSYMSPEQIRGLDLDTRSDLWSLGIVLYEMMFGKTPFPGATSVEKLATVLYEEPEVQENTPDEMAAIFTRAFQKDPDKRYQTAAEIISDLKHLKQEMDFAEQLHIHVTSGPGEVEMDQKLTQFLSDHPTVQIESPTFTGRLSRRYTWKTVVFYSFLALILLTGGYFWFKSYRIERANENLKKVEDLARAEKNFEAYDLAMQVDAVLPENEELAKLWPAISDTLTVHSEPAGARVFLRRFQKDANGKFPQRELVGQTPIDQLRIPRGNYIMQLEKDGYTPFERTISGTLPRIGGSFIETPPLKIETRLVEADKTPARMVYVPAGEYALVNWSRSTEAKVDLSDFFIDKYEVTNAEFKEFIAAGGYWKKEYWRYPVKKDGREVPIDDALKEFRDTTGLPGPRSWTNQTFPDGKANYPVTDITWYEASAYAEFRGKKLPTVFQWEKAARDGTFDPRYNAMPWGFIRQGETTDDRANMRGTGTVGVESNEFGMSPFGAYNMAGNVYEWNLNQSPEGFITSGGAWNDLSYSFGDYGEYPGMYYSNRIGFRCVLNSADLAGNQGAGMLSPAEAPDYKPSSDADFRIWQKFYEYDKKSLNAKVTDTVETPDWQRERITFNGEGGETAIGYLYLPKNYKRPLQVIHYVPPGDVVRGLRSLTDSVEMFVTPLIKSGRAVFAVVLEGYTERPFAANYALPDQSTIEFRKQMVNWITDLRLGVDYVETRSDLDKNKIAFLGISNGANLGLVLTAVETRYKTLLFESAGLEKDFRTRIAETSPINFASQVRTQKLFINGRYDETFPYNTDVKPLEKLLRKPSKMVTYDGGHIPTIEYFAPMANGWLDETLGNVAK
jgi:eukaryotic-like serine/threonine-protein kinase